MWSCCDHPEANIGSNGVGGLRLELFALERCLDRNPLFSGNVFDALPVGIHVVSKLVDVGRGDVDKRGAAFALFECA